MGEVVTCRMDFSKAFSTTLLSKESSISSLGMSARPVALPCRIACNHHAHSGQGHRQDTYDGRSETTLLKETTFLKEQVHCWHKALLPALNCMD